MTWCSGGCKRSRHGFARGCGGPWRGSERRCGAGRKTRSPARCCRCKAAGTAITARIGSDAPYAAIHEYGGTTRAHLIEAKNAQSLAFLVGGKRVFAKRVFHPGSHVPERSFLRSALAEFAPEISAELAEAAGEAAQP